MLIDEPIAEALPVGALGEHEQELALQLQAAVDSHERSGDPRDLDAGFVLARRLLAGLMRPDIDRPAGIDELRRLVDELPALGGLLDRAADTAGEAIERSCGTLFASLQIARRAPRWSAAERDTARMVFAYACGPVTATSPEWLARSLRRISAPRIAAAICEELSRREVVWRAALGDGYASLRHRCAPRTALRSRGLAELLRGDAGCRRAVTARLEQWVIAGGAVETLPQELEAAVVHARTPSRLA
ncbi:MAG TPA: hypothetical protein VKV21_10460 [Solirubrobacteraceae bacterium]|nr:hypothetical protein [Solirubrobacteraceae bacterium]